MSHLNSTHRQLSRQQSSASNTLRSQKSHVLRTISETTEPRSPTPITIKHSISVNTTSNVSKSRESREFEYAAEMYDYAGASPCMRQGEPFPDDYIMSGVTTRLSNHRLVNSASAPLERLSGQMVGNSTSLTFSKLSERKSFGEESYNSKELNDQAANQVYYDGDVLTPRSSCTLDDSDSIDLGLNDTIESKHSQQESGISWRADSIPGQHLWVKAKNQNSQCYLSKVDALDLHHINQLGVTCCVAAKDNPKLRCRVCHVVVHDACKETLEKCVDCKQTFIETTVNDPADYLNSPSFPMLSTGKASPFPQTQPAKDVDFHHWLCLDYDQINFEKKCKGCLKGFSIQKYGLPKTPFLKPGQVFFCTWCKATYHVECFNESLSKEKCSFGVFNQLVLPPSWVIKIKQADPSPIMAIGNQQEANAKFIIRPSASIPLKGHDPLFKKPLLVLVNPKSGGRMGEKLVQRFSWFLNPRQVFDLKKSGGPKLPLTLFRNVPNLRILACGGDGTVGWVLSACDQINFAPEAKPAVAVLPLGTGNDMSRALNWGPAYLFEPVQNILKKVLRSHPIKLDRWQLDIEPIEGTEECAEATDKLPTHDICNYFSLGADAQICLGFHENREKKETKHASRLLNLIQYSKVSGKDFIKRSWRTLSDFIELECDGVDFTKKIRDRGYHCIIILNLPMYAGGSNPWGKSRSKRFQPQSFNDGLLEVVGNFTNTLPLLKIGIPGERICQAKHIRIVTRTVVPVQVDGEPARLAPSQIEISFKNQVDMLENSPESS